MNFTVLILGSDANAYYMARCAHELYGKKVDMMSKGKIAVTEYSKIIQFIEIPEIYESDIFVETLNTYAEEKGFEKVVLIATNDKYVRLIAENAHALDKKFVHNYPTKEIVDTLLVKDNFYRAYGKELNVPKTLVYECGQKQAVADDFVYPIILKPGNAIEYGHHPFPDMAKVYKIQSFAELMHVIKKIEDAGYRDNLIIQEFIPGDDSALFDAVFYIGSDKKVQLMTFAQIGLQERTPTGVGNCTVLVNGFDEYGYKEKLITDMAAFLEKIGYQGFAEFDLKYDSRDGSYKVFEINPRQARSSYYLTACGHNLIEYLVNDLIYHKTQAPVIMKNKMVLSFVPKSVMYKYITSNALKAEIRTLVREGKFVRPLHYPKDMGLMRSIYLLLRDINYILKYRKLTW